MSILQCINNLIKLTDRVKYEKAQVESCISGIITGKFGFRGSIHVWIVWEHTFVEEGSSADDLLS
jgi:hypothetical protein